MNRQQGPHCIEWTDWTWNPVGGCKHGCRWEMPDGTIAACYAERVAQGVAQAHYPDGFAAHTWRPGLLDEPLAVRTPAKIFLDSMADLFGSWVPQTHIDLVLVTVARAHWHTFQVLTRTRRACFNSRTICRQTCGRASLSRRRFSGANAWNCASR